MAPEGVSVDPTGSLFVSDTAPLEGGEAGLRATLATAAAAPVTPPTTLAAKPWPYTDFGPPGRIVRQLERQLEHFFEPRDTRTRKQLFAGESLNDAVQLDESRRGQFGKSCGVVHAREAARLKELTPKRMNE